MSIFAIRTSPYHTKPSFDMTHPSLPCRSSFPVRSRDDVISSYFDGKDGYFHIRLTKVFFSLSHFIGHKYRRKSHRTTAMDDSSPAFHGFAFEEVRLHFHSRKKVRSSFVRVQNEQFASPLSLPPSRTPRADDQPLTMYRPSVEETPVRSVAASQPTPITPVTPRTVDPIRVQPTVQYVAH